MDYNFVDLTHFPRKDFRGFFICCSGDYSKFHCGETNYIAISSTPLTHNDWTITLQRYDNSKMFVEFVINDTIGWETSL